MLYPIELWALSRKKIEYDPATAAGNSAGPAFAATEVTMLSIALKEWDLLITALLEGRQAILLRKGGILEAENQFTLEHSRFLFFSTFIHQDPRMVKPAYRAGLTSVRTEPERITLRGYGEAARIFEVPSRRQLELLDDLHIWDAPLLDMRFAYRPEKPLYLVVVRAYVLPSPVTVANTLEYAGCKSWVPLEEAVDTACARPALTDEQLTDVVGRIEAAFGVSGQ
jgi:hypothetical protein